jgi:enoyl-CoA hydratase
MSELVTSNSGGLGRITLNKPETLHALNAHMVANMIQALLAWRDDASVKAVLIEHQPGTRGFCAGGDIRFLAESGAGDGVAGKRFFYTEYQLNHLLFSYSKPVIALMDGVTMGGGVGLAMPAKFRVATENTTYAMPETGIGLFPDVGGGWYLPRKPGQIGMWLALTGARIKAADCLAAGIATQFVSAEKLPALRDALTADQSNIEAAITPLTSDAGAVKELTAENIARINKLFAGDSVEAIVAALEADGSDWAQAQLKTLATKSPQTLKVAFRQLREGAKAKSFADNMVTEFRIGARVLQRHDFLEGVRAIIVEKDNKPVWDPPTLAGVTPEILDSIFAPLPANEEWKPL